VTLYIYRRSICLQTVLEHNRRSTWRRQLWEWRDSLGGLCGEKICFSPPPPQLNLTGGSQWGAYGDTGIMEAYHNTGLTEKISAKFNSVRKLHAILPDTPGDLTSASKHFQTLPDPPGDKQSALRLCKSIHRCSWEHLQLWRCIQDAPSRIVKYRSSWDLCADLRETSREAETAVQLCGILRERPRPLHSSAGDLMPYSHCSGSYITTRHFVLSYSSLLQSQDLLHYNMACIIWVSLYIYIRLIWPQMVLEHNQKRSRPLRELLEMHHWEAVALKWWS